MAASIGAGTLAYLYHAQRYSDGTYTREGAEAAWVAALVVFVLLLTALVAFHVTGSARGATGIGLLVAIVFVASGMPRNAAQSIVEYGFGPDADPGSTVSYVALGDSYASGEGVPPFEPASDGNGCHRSQSAYPRTLDARRDDVDLVYFAACSGATADTVRRDGQNGEAAQVQQLRYVDTNTPVELVTVTLGGNPVFRQVALDCLLSDCTVATTYVRSYFATTAFTDGLRQAYREVAAAAPRSRVVVMTYPRPFPKIGQSQGESPCAGKGIVEGVTITAPEVRAINSLVADLNSQIRQVALSEEALVVDVEDAFSQHELCGSGESYLNKVNVVQREYSFHPNEAGQGALASELESELQDSNVL